MTRVLWDSPNVSKLAQRVKQRHYYLRPSVFSPGTLTFTQRLWPAQLSQILERVSISKHH